ncbi:PorP/SprF family type IX secretion system membrane protein [Flavobacteriaceae bacterium M23B6Z8]
MNNCPKKIAFIASILILIVIPIQIEAQQTPGFAEYNYNPYLINGAFAGLAGTTEMSLTNSGFFNSLEGSPETFGLTIHTDLNRGKVGLGAGFIRDQLGVTTSTRGFATYAYRIFFDTKRDRPYWQIYTPNALSFSISAGLQQYEENLLSLGIMNDPNFAQNINATIPTLGVGVLLNLAQFYVGFSSPNIFGDSLANDDALDLSAVYHGYLGYHFFSDRFEEFMIKPNALIKYENGAPLQVDLNVSMNFKKRFEVGAGYRTNSSINLLAGIYVLENLRAIYQYNIASADTPFGNTHGIVISYRFGKGFYEN